MKNFKILKFSFILGFIVFCNIILSQNLIEPTEISKVSAGSIWNIKSNNNGIMFAFGDSRCFRSFDNGESWEEILQNEIVYDFSINELGYIITSTLDKTLISFDDSETWIEVDQAGGKFIDSDSTIYFSSNGQLFCAYYENNYNTLEILLEDYYGPIQDILVKDDTIYLATNELNFLKKNKYGGTWQINQVDDPSIYYFPQDKFCNGINIVNGNIFVLTGRNIFKSEDWGNNWESIFPQHWFLRHYDVSDQNEIIIYSRDWLGMGSNKGIFYSDDGGNNWDKLEDWTGGTYTTCFQFHGEYIFSSQEFSGILKHKIGSSYSFIKFDFTDGQITSAVMAPNGDIYVSTFNLGLFKSTDQGLSWTPIPDNVGLSVTNFRVEYCNNYVYAQGYYDNRIEINSNYLENIDNGLTLNEAGSGLATDEENNVIYSAHGSKIITYNYGTNNIHTTNGSISGVTVDKNGVAYILQSYQTSYLLRRSNNFGISWETVSVVPYPGSDFLWYNEERIFTKAGLYSDDYGVSWDNMGQNIYRFFDAYGDTILGLGLNSPNYNTELLYSFNNGNNWNLFYEVDFDSLVYIDAFKINDSTLCGFTRESRVFNFDITNLNQAPVADAGINIVANSGIEIELNGSGSNDPEGMPLIYAWKAPEEIELLDTSIVNPTFITPYVLEPTDFEIILTVSDTDLLDSDTLILTVNNNFTSFEKNFRNIDKVNIWPNPSSTIISIDIPSTFSDKYEVKIISYSGLVVFDKLYINRKLIEIPVSQLPAGVYLLSISNNKNTELKKITVNH